MFLSTLLILCPKCGRCPVRELPFVPPLSKLLLLRQQFPSCHTKLSDQAALLAAACQSVCLSVPVSVCHFVFLSVCNMEVSCMHACIDSFSLSFSVRISSSSSFEQLGWFVVVVSAVRRSFLLFFSSNQQQQQQQSALHSVLPLPYAVIHLSSLLSLSIYLSSLSLEEEKNLKRRS